MGEIGLVETIASLRAELADAVEEAGNEDIQFPVAQIDLEFRVGVTRDVHGSGKLKFWILELGASGGYEAETIQKIIIGLGAPVDADGEPIKVRRRMRDKP